MRSNVSDEMLAETSRTTIPVDAAGSDEPVAGRMREAASSASSAAETSTAADAPRASRASRPDCSNAAASPSGIALTGSHPPSRSTRSARVARSGGTGSGRDQAIRAASDESPLAPTRRPT